MRWEEAEGSAYGGLERIEEDRTGWGPVLEILVKLLLLLLPTIRAWHWIGVGRGALEDVVVVVVLSDGADVAAVFSAVGLNSGAATDRAEDEDVDSVRGGRAAAAVEATVQSVLVEVSSAREAGGTVAQAASSV